MCPSLCPLMALLQKHIQLCSTSTCSQPWILLRLTRTEQNAILPPKIGQIGGDLDSKQSLRIQKLILTGSLSTFTPVYSVSRTMKRTSFIIASCQCQLFPSTVSSVMTAGDIDHRGGVITPLCSEYHVLVFIECGQTVLYFDTTQKKRKKELKY